MSLELLTVAVFASIIVVLCVLLLKQQKDHAKQVNTLHAHYQHEMRTQNLFIMAKSSAEYAGAASAIVQEQLKKSVRLAPPFANDPMRERMPEV